MRYVTFTPIDWEAYQAARKTPATKRGFVKELDFEAGRETLKRAGIEILPKEMIPSAPPCVIIISRRPRIKNFDGIVIRPEDSATSYFGTDSDYYKEIPFVNNLEALMGDPLDDVKKLLNIVFGEGKDGGN